MFVFNNMMMCFLSVVLLFLFPLKRFRLLTPCTLTQNLVQIQRHRFLGDQSFNFFLQIVGQNSHQGLGGEPVLGALLVITYSS